MAGGLIELSTYGSQDLFLTGTPEITFFKIVYRRHTNFSMESVSVDFDDTTGFGEYSVLTVPKLGDLLHKAYLHITLPKINFKKELDSASILEAGALLTTAQNEYNIVTSFMSVNTRAFIAALDVIQADNRNDSQDIISAVNLLFNDVTNSLVVQEFRELMENTTLSQFLYNEVSMEEIVNNVDSLSTHEDYLDAMLIGIDKSIKVQKSYFNEYFDKKNAYENSQVDNLNFAWVDRVGHSLIEEMEVRIGGHKIDKHLGDWINIWYELTANRDMEAIYNKMIGNVPELTTFDNTIKNKYELFIPLQFWFCRHSGLSIPLVALEYHDVTFHIKFRKLEQVSYIEENTTIYIPSRKENIFLDEAVAELGVNIEASIFFDYIYLGTNERRRFAQSSHEYLIEQVQYLEFRNVRQNEISCVLNNFVHPSKELIWVAQKESYIRNLDGYTKARWDNYSLTDENVGNPVLFSTIDFHSYNRVIRSDGNYFNYVQPFEAHTATPSDGINVYSFAINAEEIQPTGSANLSRISRVNLSLEFDPFLFENDDSLSFTIRIYARNINILRFISGLAGTAFTYG